MKKFFIIVGMLMFLALVTDGFAGGPMRLRRPQPHSPEYYRLLAERNRRDKLEDQLCEERIHMTLVYFFSVVGAVGFGFLVKSIDDSRQRRCV